MWNWLGISNEKKTADSSPVEKTEDGEPQQGDAKNESGNIEVDKNPDATRKVKDVATNLGSYLYNFANVAGQTASKWKETVDEKLEQTIIGDFQRENDKFIHEKEARRIGDAVPPWEGFHEESAMKRQILALSADERNFLRDPPNGVEFSFDLSQMMPVALAALNEDDDLKAMRFKLVPKRVKEEKFWKNYFYRVTLIKQSTQLSTMADLELNRSSMTSSSESLNTKGGEKIKDTSTEDQEGTVFPDVDQENAGSPSTNEFVSDAFQTHEEGLSEEEKKQMLGVGDKVDSVTKQDTDETKTLEDWEIEQELQEELESFELVNENTPSADDGKWEQEIEDMLELEENENKSNP